MLKQTKISPAEIDRNKAIDFYLRDFCCSRFLDTHDIGNNFMFV